MATCKECLHLEVCAYCIDGVTTCDSFKDKAAAIEVPCKIGDFVWAIRNYKGVLHPHEGVVSEMYFTLDMRLQIVVSHIARGQWGEQIFPTCAAAERAILKRRKQNET